MGENNNYDQRGICKIKKTWATVELHLLASRYLSSYAEIPLCCF